MSVAFLSILQERHGGHAGVRHNEHPDFSQYVFWLITAVHCKAWMYYWLLDVSAAKVKRFLCLLCKCAVPRGNGISRLAA